MATETAGNMPTPTLFGWLRRMRDREEQGSPTNQLVLRALEEDKREGQYIATIARTVALTVIALLLPFLNQTIGVLYYEAFVVGFVAIGWAQLRVAKVGRSRTELALIFLELAMLTFICVVPSPFVADGIPTAFGYRFNVFIYFFVILAISTLAYSWRTIFSIGTWVAALWLVAVVGVALFGEQNAALHEAAVRVFSAYPDMLEALDPNNPQISQRIQELVVFMLVAGILALKGWRSNELLMKQAYIAAERANLSRYFSPNMVDVLASDDHDVGAVRTQDVAVVFIDIVGFTEISERSTPHQVMDLLRRYLSLVEGVIFEYGGTLDKYLGDGVMATFGTPEPKPADAINALKAAREIVHRMDWFNRDSAARGAPEIRVSVGLHFGPVILGDVGPSRRLEFAVLGDTVNVASRLESASRELDCRIVASSDVLESARCSELLDDRSLLAGFRPAPAVSLRGRKAPVDVWTF
jgi:adenylate cyclase